MCVCVSLCVILHTYTHSLSLLSTSLSLSTSTSLTVTHHVGNNIVALLDEPDEDAGGVQATAVCKDNSLVGLTSLCALRFHGVFLVFLRVGGRGGWNGAKKNKKKSVFACV